MWEPEPGLYCWPRLTTDDFANTTWCGGSVGIILFLIMLYEASADETYLNYARGATDWLVHQAYDGGEGTYKWTYGPQSSSFPFAYCHGTPSVVHVLYILHEYTQNPVYIEYARGGAEWMMKEAEVIEEGICRWPHIQGYSHETGLLCGTAGVGNSFLLYYTFDPDEQYLEYAKYAAQWLISVAEHNQLNEMKWINYVDDVDYGQKEYETGWYSGASGVGLFFLKLSQILPDSSIGKKGIQRR
jgi:lantibiotic modifying enzyme